MSKTGSVILIVLFGALFLYALWDGNKTGIITTGLIWLLVCLMQAFVLVPRLRRWNQPKG